MEEIKSGREGPVTYGSLSVTGLTPEPVERRIIDLFTAKTTAVMTNVPVRREPVYLAGTPVRTAIVWAPTSGHMGMSVCIFSYRGEVTIGLMTDAALVPDPDHIVMRLERELRSLCAAQKSASPAPATNDIREGVINAQMGTHSRGRRAGARAGRRRASHRNRFNQVSKITLTAKKAGQSSGIKADVHSTDPAAPGQKPKAAQRLVITFPAGTKFNFGRVKPCTLSHKQLTTVGCTTCWPSARSAPARRSRTRGRCRSAPSTRR